MSKLQTILSAPDGRVLGVDRRRIGELPFFLLTNQPNNEIAVGAFQAAGPYSMRLSGDGPAQIISFAAQRTGAARVYLLIRDGKSEQGLMNGACHIDTIFGSAQKPYYLPEGLYIDEGRALKVVITDLTGFQNNVRLLMNTQRYLNIVSDANLEKAKERLKAREFLTLPYFYTFDNGPVTLTALGTSTQSISLLPNFHFQLFQLTSVSTGLFTLDIIDGNTGSSLFDAPQGTHFEVSSGLVCGNGNYPFKLHEPRLYMASQKIIVKLTDRSGAPNTVHLTLGGRNIADRMWR